MPLSGLASFFTRVLYQSLGTWGTPCADLLVVLHTDQNLSRSFRSCTLFLFCPVDVWHNTGHLCLSSWKQASRTSSPRLDFGPYRNTKNHDPPTVGRLDFELLFFLTCCQKPIKHVPWHFLCWLANWSAVSHPSQRPILIRHVSVTKCPLFSSSEPAIPPGHPRACVPVFGYHKLSKIFSLDLFSNTNGSPSCISLYGC